MRDEPLFRVVDAVTIPVPDLERGLEFYRAVLGHELRWRNDAIGMVGLGLARGETELVLTTDLQYEPNWLVDSADRAAEEVRGAGGAVLVEPFDIPVGRVAVVADPFGNRLVLIDLSKGRYVTDDTGAVVGVAPEENSAKTAFLSRFSWDGGHADVWRVFDDGAVFAQVIAGLVEPWRHQGITKVCGIESRGFIVGGAAASALGVGFVAIRKQGNLFPGPKRQVETASDYRGTRHVLQIQERSLRSGDRVLLVDDWIERGSQARAARDLIEGCGAVLAGIAVVVDQLDDIERGALPVLTSIVAGSDLPA